MRLQACVLAALALAFLHSSVFAQTPANFKIAFIGDQGLGANSVAVLELIRTEGANAVVHSGDYDYADAPLAWENQINGVLGADFPYFASIGNHDTGRFDGPGGYQEFLQARMIRLGLSWNGDLGVKSSHVYAGILFVLTGPGTRGSGHAAYIRDTLAGSSAPWRISSWHRNMRLMQVGGKSDDTGWEVYEESRRGGAIIATAHEHSYSRTHLLSSMMNQVVVSLSDTLRLSCDLSATLTSDEGASFAFVSGLGGQSIRDQEIGGPWWASVYTSTQGATYGALFGEFRYGGDERLAHFYFKAIDGTFADDFWVHSEIQLATASTGPAGGDAFLSVALQGNPVREKLSVLYSLAQPEFVSLFVYDVRGRLRIAPFAARLQAAGEHRWDWELVHQQNPAGTYFLRLATPGASRTLRFVVLE